MESTNEELKSANEEIMSMNEEPQAANEELETSKEELQSLNEELTTVNSQLQNKLEELEETNNDLNNLLTSTDIATLFLDRRLHIKRFTPATRRLFNLISTDVGRSIDDIAYKFEGGDLRHDAEVVLDRLTPLEREVRTVDDRWYIQRLLPYQTQDNRIGGVVATFIDITERKSIEEALRQAKAAAEQANDQKSQFLAAASHDLRQPLQTLSLFNAVLAKKVQDQEAIKLVIKQGETLKFMEDLLNALLDIGQLDAGKVTPKLTIFSADELFSGLNSEFGAQAREKGLVFRVRPCKVRIRSDRAFLERILHNFLANAIKHTDRGKLLAACHRRGSNLRIEVWDTGCGIPQDQLKAIFTEFYQIDNPARERGKGLGLGLAIAERLARLLDHRLDVRSTPGKGSMFAVEVPIATEVKPGEPEQGEAERQPVPPRRPGNDPPGRGRSRRGRRPEHVLEGQGFSIDPGGYGR